MFDMKCYICTSYVVYRVQPNLHIYLLAYLEIVYCNEMVNWCLYVCSTRSSFVITNMYLHFQEETISRYIQIIFDRIKPKLPQYFKNIPDLPLV